MEAVLPRDPYCSVSIEFCWSRCVEPLHSVTRDSTHQLARPIKDSLHRTSGWWMHLQLSWPACSDCRVERQRLLLTHLDHNIVSSDETRLQLDPGTSNGHLELKSDDELPVPDAYAARAVDASQPGLRGTRGTSESGQPTRLGVLPRVASTPTHSSKRRRKALEPPHTSRARCRDWLWPWSASNVAVVDVGG